MGRQAGTRGLFAAFSGIVLLVGIALFGQLPGDNHLWIEIQNTGHLPLFGVLAILVLFVLRALLPGLRTRTAAGYLLSAGISLAAGIGVEFGQQLTKNHSFDIGDVRFDLAGILLALAVYAIFDVRMKPAWHAWRPGLRPFVLVLSASLLLVLLAPLASHMFAYQQRDAAFPVIMDFSAGWSGPFLELRDAVLDPVMPARTVAPPGGHHLAQLTLEAGRYPGITIVDPYPDWSGYKTLVVNIYSDMPWPDGLILRIHDRLHNNIQTDRFNRMLAIDKGMNHFRIPLAAIEAAPAGRRMDLRHIAGLVLFAHPVQQSFKLYPGRIWLE